MKSLFFDTGQLNETCEEILKWSDQLWNSPSTIRDKVVYLEKDTPLYVSAFLADNGVKAVLLEEGGKNYHPKLLLNDAQIPVLGGIKYSDSLAPLRLISKKQSDIKNFTEGFSVLVNIGHDEAIRVAKDFGASGIGIFRTEFTAVRSVYKHLLDTFSETVTNLNEADEIYAMAKDTKRYHYLVKDLENVITKAVLGFPSAPVLIRTLDIPKNENDQLGLRGIRRCLHEGGYTLKAVFEAVKKVKTRFPNSSLGILIPLVSDYSQIKHSIKYLNESGLSIQNEDHNKHTHVDFGWKIETPASALCSKLWVNQFVRDFGIKPQYIGIGSNDLTQFNLAVDRNTSEINVGESKLYNELNLANLILFIEVMKMAKTFNIQLIFQGEVASNPFFALLLKDQGFWPSVSPYRIPILQEKIIELGNLTTLELLRKLMYDGNHQIDQVLLKEMSLKMIKDLNLLT